jgi:hypothetical protein
MPRFSRSCPRAAGLFLLPVLATACVDGSPTMPAPQGSPAVAMPAMQCDVNVQAETVHCTVPNDRQARNAISANRIFGGQDEYVKLASTGASYDSGTEIFTVNVTVQNLLQAALGTTDGSTVNGVKIFFSQGPIAYPSGVVTVANATGSDFFTDTDQPYFLYPQILQPYEISASQPWEFNVPNGVAGFTFVVYVSAPQADEMMPMLGHVWLGSTSTDWFTGSNWNEGVAPDSASAVAVPPDSLVTGTFMPALTADAELTHLRVGGGSTLDLGGFALTAWGNVDAPGTISGGTLHVAGTGALLRGTLPSLVVTGSAELQGAARTSAAVSISGGSLSVSGSPLTISIP